MPAKSNIQGPQGQFYADPKHSPDESAFQVDNTSAAYYSSVYYKMHKSEVQAIPPPRDAKLPLHLELADFIPKTLADAIAKAGQIVFHAVGDTGAAKSSARQEASTSIAEEAAVADAMTADVQNGGDAGPAFFFHLGDVIYNFGEDVYYYDQFYEPYRGYDRPIFAIPGNHDGMVFGPGTAAPKIPTLAAFLTNFCAPSAKPSPDAPSIVRSTMTQPAVYFTLDAPFVSIIGLYSNVMDSGGGIISSQGGHFPISDVQLTFLINELQRLKPDRDAGKRAVIVAVHHPPLSVDAKTGGSGGLMQDIDACCKKAGLWPDIVLSGHSHLYQRFTRTLNGRQVPYIVSGSGGFAATPPPEKSPPEGTVIGDHKLEKGPYVKFGYMTLITDAKTISLSFQTAPRGGAVTQMDFVALDLKSGKITKNGIGAAGNASSKAGKSKGKTNKAKAAKPKSKRR